MRAPRNPHEREHARARQETRFAVDQVRSLFICGGRNGKLAVRARQSEANLSHAFEWELSHQGYRPAQESEARAGSPDPSVAYACSPTATPIRKIIGDLSDTERVLVGLDIKSGK